MDPHCPVGAEQGGEGKSDGADCSAMFTTYERRDMKSEWLPQPEASRR